MNNKIKKLNQIIELDWIKINLDAYISNKKQILYFQEKDIITLFLNRLCKLLQIKIFYFLIVRIINRLGLKSLLFAYKIKNSDKIERKQKVFILPGEIKHAQIKGFSILVILHVYHVEELEKILTYLQNIPEKYLKIKYKILMS